MRTERGQRGVTSRLRRALVVLGQWLGLGALVGVICGAGSALFLWSLDRATTFRIGHDTIIFALPVAGLAIGWLYERFGAPVRPGTNLVIDTLHEGGPAIPVRMASMVFGGTILTHLFGGSAGREGTAVQMGASLSDYLSHRLGLREALRHHLLVAGVAGGFASVFGTPIAGIVFGLELVRVQRLDYRAVVPAAVAALVGDQVTRALGIVHTPYPAAPHLGLDATVIGTWIVFAAAIAIATIVFIELTHAIKRVGERHLRRLPLRMFIGGALVVLAWQALGTGDYLGLGVPTIVRSFTDPALPAYAFAIKLGLTAITIGAGFLGGEVTPLFFVGATLGNALAQVFGLPLELGAAVGMAAMFGAASNTPLALSIMAIELCGTSVLPHVAIVAGLAFVLSGHRSIYPAQRLVRGKLGQQLAAPIAIRALHDHPKAAVKSR